MKETYQINQLRTSENVMNVMLWGDCKVGVGGLIFCLVVLDFFFVKMQFMDSLFFCSLPTLLIISL